MRRIDLLSCLPALCVSFALAQSTPPSKTPNPAVTVAAGANAATESAYKDEALVYETLSEIYTYAADGTGEKRTIAVMRMQSDAAVKQFTIVGIPFASSTEKVVIHSLRVHHVDGSAVETPAADGMEMPQPISQQAPFYSDLKRMQIPVRSLRVGDKLEYDVSVVRTSSEAPNEFWGLETFAKNIVILKQTVELHVPQSKYVQVWSPNHKPETHDEGGMRVYRWSSSQLKPTPKKVENTAQGPQLPEIQWTTFRSWASVGDWYRNLSKGRAEPSSAVKAKADELVAGLKTDEEKIHALYNFVSLQVRYVGVAFGVGRYQPHQSGEILLTGYGDCKDKHTLLQAMLTAEGIHADPALIGAGIKLNEEVPSPASFNHLITAIPQNGKTLWLDTTAEVAPYGMLVNTIRDTKGLIVREGSDAILEKTPTNPPFDNVDKFEAEGTLNDKGELTAHSKLTLRGDTEVSIRAAVRQVAPVQMDQMMQYLSSAMGFGGTVSDTRTTPAEKTEEPLTLEYDYKRAPYGDWPNRQIIPLSPFLSLPGVDEENPPKEAIELGGPKIEIAISKIHLPSETGAKLPPDIHEKSEYGSLDKTYKLTNNTIIVERTMAVAVKEVPAADWKKYQTFFKATAGRDEPWIRLTGLGGDSSVEDADPAVASLMQDAEKAGDRSDWQQENALLNQIEKLNPKEPYLYSMRGYVLMRQMKFEDAESNFRRELAAHPKEDNVWHLLVAVLQMRKDNRGVEKALRDATNSLPQEKSFPLQLQDLLAKDGKSEEAVAVMRDAIKHQPDEATLKAQLGELLLRTKKNDEAVTTLKPLLDSSDISVVNSAAYALSNAGAHLDLAEQAERRAVGMLEERIGTPGADTGDGTVRDCYELISFWDTLGWILYQEGKLDAAEPYLRSSWNNTYVQEIGLHYGHLLEKQNKLDEAHTVYSLALLGTKQGVPGVGEELAAATKRTGKKKGGDFPPLQTLRTYPLKSKEKSHSYVTLQLRLGVGGIEDVVRIRGNDGLDSHLAEVKTLDLKPQGIPAESKAKLLRRAILSCGTSGCEVVLIPMESAADPAL